jgi:hypothetical protein
LTLDDFNQLVETMPRYWRHQLAGAAHALDRALREGEDDAPAVARISADPRYAPALVGSGQMANFQSIAEPEPVLNALSAGSFVIGSPNVALHAFGSGFTVDSQISFAGNVERTDFWNARDISTVINAALWGGPDTVEVFVVNPAGQSEPLEFAFVAP